MIQRKELLSSIHLCSDLPRGIWMGRSHDALTFYVLDRDSRRIKEPRGSHSSFLDDRLHEREQSKGKGQECKKR